jgi:hypothetical protein
MEKAMALYYKDQPIRDIYILDWDNEYQPENMRGKPYYLCPSRPAQNATKSSFEDMIDLASFMAFRVGGDSKRVSFFIEMSDFEPLIEVTSEVLDQISDC